MTTKQLLRALLSGHWDLNRICLAVLAQTPAIREPQREQCQPRFLVDTGHSWPFQILHATAIHLSEQLDQCSSYGYRRQGGCRKVKSYVLRLCRSMLDQELGRPSVSGGVLSQVRVSTHNWPDGDTEISQTNRQRKFLSSDWPKSP